MRVVILFGLVCCALGLASLSAAQAIAVDSRQRQVMPLSTTSLSGEAKTVVDVDVSWAHAYQSCDLKTLDTIVDEDIIFIGARGAVDTKPVLMKEIFGPCNNETAIVNPIRVLVLNR